MARILLFHPDRSGRRVLEELAQGRHKANAVGDVRSALKAMARSRPEVVVLGLTGKRIEALEILRHLQRSSQKIPAIVVAPPDAGTYQPVAMKLGAASFLEVPLEQAAFDEAVSSVTSADWQARGKQPPISEEESRANLTELEARLNRQMKCFAGKNQVFIQSFVLGGGRTSQPRISLKCPLRQQYGDPPNVYYEYIRDVCCANPSACSAYQTFKAKHSA